MRKIIVSAIVLFLLASCGGQRYVKEVPQDLTPDFQYGAVAPPTPGTEQYAEISENEFRDPKANPLSTFSIDVDKASYANVRRFLTDGSLPPLDAVRIEELLNYFKYDYPQPGADQPFSVVAEASVCPWNREHRLIHIGLQGRRLDMEDLPQNNLVFLLDCSGSMSDRNKLPLLKSAMKMMVDDLRPYDRVAIVTYSNDAVLRLPSTPGRNRGEILNVIDRLNADGSTAGAAGIQLAYKVAQENFLENGNNRILLATDGDFNVGISSDAELERLISTKRDEGVFLSVLGFGIGNVKDAKMELLADKGNGTYYYIDNIKEAHKTLVAELGATLKTIAKDVKVQVEFNPEHVRAYRLIGYENRLLRPQDFDNDRKDAGDIGAGHSVTALYEVIPADENYDRQLRYEQAASKPSSPYSDELMFVRLRYKNPDEVDSKLLELPIENFDLPLLETSDDYRFSAAVAQFGLLLRQSEFRGDATFSDVLELARSALGEDVNGERHEFMRLVETAELLTGAGTNDQNAGRRY